jgi:hypothetical protein
MSEFDIFLVLSKYKIESVLCEKFKRERLFRNVIMIDIEVDYALGYECSLFLIRTDDNIIYY